mmetsp:Transcript_39548/g.86141  ORF Transcript_39548/g.86141 Transcript_39548/m.86141 type:complete len:349 (-) Transcript_39548:522-1568(-)
MLAAAYNVCEGDPSAKYEVVERIGQGAFGEVLKAVHLPTGGVVALKKVMLRRPEKGIPDNVLREIKLLQQVDHPNVVHLHEVFAMGSSLALSCEYCSSDLSEVVKRSCWRLEAPVVKGIMLQLLRGVAAMHRARVLHRDLKPSNVLLSERGVVKVADFGLARVHDRSGDYTHTVATRWYRAPELLYGARRYGTGVDMWAVGCIFAELLGKGPLVPGEHDIDQLFRVIQLLGNPKEEDWPELTSLPDFPKISFPPMPGIPLEEVLPDAPPSALTLLRELLAYNPRNRPSAEQVLAKSAYFFEDPLPALPADIPVPPPKTASGRAESFDMDAPLSIPTLSPPSSPFAYWL